MKFILSAALSVFLFFAATAQKTPDRWFNLDYKQDGVAGVSADKALNELLKDRKAEDVIVAVIDGGTDAAHEDLKDNMWVNTKEIPGNGIDDDNNGYVDDINGWDFIGGSGGTVQYDNMELTRIYRDLKGKYLNMDPKQVPSAQKAEYALFQEVKGKYEKMFIKARTNYEFYSSIEKSINALKREIGKTKLTNEDIISYKTSNSESQQGLTILKNVARGGGDVSTIDAELREAIEHFETQYKYHLNVDYDPRTKLVGDNYNDLTSRNYGNNNVKGPDAMHGTHVAGIIGAVRGNGTGMDGVANHVKIMVVRCVPDGDERDKDVANAIRYAADNGAKIINMSFGKYYGTQKAYVDEAVKYAMSKDVLIVHAAGNEGYDLKGKQHYPTRTYADKSGEAKSWIEVGASQPNMQPASFSCYGKKEVDLFAPGTEIYSTTPDNTYKSLQGTSMASPVTAGCAAIIRAYFPALSAEQVKDILLKSVYKVPGKVTCPMDDDKQEKAQDEGKELKPKSVKFSKLCKSGGIVNAYNAAQLALSMEAAKSGK